MNNRGTTVDLGEEHVARDFHVVDAVTIGDLNILHFCGLSVAFELFYSQELDLHGLDIELRVTFDDEAVEGLSETAVC